jgi:putative DNA primase/helicase
MTMAATYLPRTIKRARLTRAAVLTRRKPPPAIKTNGNEFDEKAAEARIADLAQLTEFTFQRRRKEAARELSITVAALEKLVRQRRTKQEDLIALPHWTVEKYEQGVSGSALLDGIRDLIRRYIALPQHAAEAMALWVLHAWAFDAFDISPFLVLVSPTKRCGKTSLLSLIYWLTPRSELASNISPSAIFRYIEDQRPTLLIDEADTFVRENEQLRGILNSGHTRTAANVVRIVEINRQHKPRRFSTWAPKAIATIKKLADTLEDRSIVVTMRRKTRDEPVARLRHRDTDEFSAFRSRALRWAADNLEALKTADPVMPNELNDRAVDNWRPLLAIADCAGGKWPARAPMAALALSGESASGEDIGVQLLRDIHAMFEAGVPVLLSRQIVENLCADLEKPWAEYSHGRPITQKQMANLLRAFHIFSDTVHPPGTHGRGYKREQFADAARRYLTAETHPCFENSVSKCASVQVAVAQRFPSDLGHVQNAAPHTSENGSLSHSQTDLHTCTHRHDEFAGRSGVSTVPERGPCLAPPGNSSAQFSYPELPPFLDRRAHLRGKSTTPQERHIAESGDAVTSHACVARPLDG